MYPRNRHYHTPIVACVPARRKFQTGAMELPSHGSRKAGKPLGEKAGQCTAVVDARPMLHCGVFEAI